MNGAWRRILDFGAPDGTATVFSNFAHHELTEARGLAGIERTYVSEL
jgi:hypothetical protein